MLNRNLLVFSALLPLTLAIAAASTLAPAAKAPAAAMAPTQAQAEATTLVYGLLSDSRYAPVRTRVQWACTRPPAT